ncbi:Vitamin B12 transporter BtuB [subsurface metagenome]
MRNFFIILAVAFLFFHSYSSAEQLPLYEIEEITVSANRIVSSGDETGTFEIITNEAIRGGNYKNVSEALQSIPGIYFTAESFLGNRTTESNTGPKIKIRGKGAKLLIDGNPMNMSIFGCLINNMLTLDHVERIEVTRGSESVLNGSDGLGGVINIITRDPEKLGAGFMMRGGQNNTVISSMDHENKIGQFGYFLSGSLKRSDGFRGDADYSDESGFLKMSYDLAPSMKLESSLNMYNNHSNDPGTQMNPEVGLWSDIKRRQADITLSAHTKSLTARFKTFYNQGHHQFDEQDGWHSRDMTSGFRTDLVWDSLEGNNRLTVGADGQWNRGKAFIDDNLYMSSGFNFWLNNKEWYDENELALFALDRHLLYEGRVSLVGGLRAIRHSDYGDFYCPKAGVAFNLDKTTVHAGYNRAYKSPSLLQMHLHKKSNSLLNPEIADHFEIGAERSFLESITLGSTVFYIDGADQVGMVYSSGKPVSFQNIGKWNHKGGELTMNWLISSHVSLAAGYTYLDTGSNTQYNPKHQGNLNTRTSWTVLGREFLLSLNCLGISQIYASNDHKDRLGDYLLLDLFADWEIYSNVSFILGINNLLDKKYESVQGYFMPGSVITAGLRLDR